MKVVVGNCYKHVKRDSKYVVTAISKLQWSAMKHLEDTLMVTYHNIYDDESWTRPLNEFADGRYIEYIQYD